MLLSPENPYLASSLYELALKSPKLPPEEFERIEKLEPQYLKSFSAAHIAGARLLAVDFTR